MKETKQKIVKTNLKTLLKRYSRSDALKNLEAGYLQETIHKIPVVDINDSRFLKDISFNVDELDEYKNVVEGGLYSPILVRPIDNKYEIIFGRELFYAALKNEISTIDCLIKNYSDEETLLIMSLYIKGKKGNHVVEEACLCNELKKYFNYKNKELCTLFKQSPAQISNIIKLTDLDHKILKMISNGEVSYGHAKAFSRLNKEQIDYVVNEILSKNLSVRETERLVFSISNQKQVNENLIITKNGITLKFDSEEKKNNALKRIEKMIKRGKIKF